MSIDMALAIDIAAVEHGQTAATVTARLVSLGGTMLSYTPAIGVPHAKATFGFETEHDRDRFALRALKIPGVSLIEA